MSAGRFTLRAFVMKEVRHILRDRQTLVILLVLPLLEVMLFGYALRTDIHDIRIAVVDPQPDDRTLALRNRLLSTPRFTLAAVLPEARALEPWFKRNEVDVAVVLPPRFADRLARGEAPQVLIITDASDPNTGSTMQAYTAAVIRDFQAELLSDPARRSSAMQIELRTRMRFNPTLESVNLFVPGLIAMVITLVTSLMTAISLSREKERGTLEVLLVSPLRPWQIIVGKVVPYVGLGLINTVTVVLVARLLFGVPLRGNPLLLLLESLIYVIVSLALGVLIAAKSATQRAAMLAALAGTMMPNALLSGMIFPIASMPPWLQPVTNIIPGRWFIVIARGIMLKGVGLTYLWRESLVLVGMALLLLVVASRSFRARLA